MGRGDRRSKRGKIWRGTYGKSRPKPSNVESESKEQQKEETTKGKK